MSFWSRSAAFLDQQLKIAEGMGDVVMDPLEIEPPTGPGRYEKVRAGAARPLDDEIAAGQPLAVVVEVAEPGYRPPGVDVRAEITDTLFTANVLPAALAELDRDPGVVAIEVGSRLDQID